MLRRQRPVPDPVGPGQESVWDYPRPPRLEPTTRHLVVLLGGEVVAETRRALRVVETAGAPVYYFPPADVAATLVASPGGSWCEWKGAARYWTVIAGGRSEASAAWSYPDPTPPFGDLRHHVAFYASRMDACFVDGHGARPQPGGFYGGWVTDDVVGPIKGAPGTEWW